MASDERNAGEASSSSSEDKRVVPSSIINMHDYKKRLKEKYAFWETQPVVQFNGSGPVSNIILVT